MFLTNPEAYEHLAEPLPITEPPCKSCHYFNPKKEYLKGGHFNGIRICQAEKMFPDFSCFKDTPINAINQELMQRSLTGKELPNFIPDPKIMTKEDLELPKASPEVSPPEPSPKDFK